MPLREAVFPLRGVSMASPDGTFDTFGRLWYKYVVAGTYRQSSKGSDPMLTVNRSQTDTLANFPGPIGRYFTKIREYFRSESGVISVEINLMQATGYSRSWDGVINLVLEAEAERLEAEARKLPSKTCSECLGTGRRAGYHEITDALIWEDCPCNPQSDNSQLSDDAYEEEYASFGYL